MLGHTHILIQQQTDEICVSTPDQHRLGALVGASERMRQLYGLIQAVAPTPATVLITGESGAGKEQAARTLHELSGRRGPLVVLDASVADPEMIRSDLFGHIRGAFTGASGPREGAFRRAQHGTLFIDEIGELPLDLQPRLLRALENREVTPLGSDQPVRVDVRVIAATHRNLWAMVQAGQFRADLFYRLWVFPIKVPALREIREDIPLLVKHLLERMSLPYRISPEAMEILKRHHWPGNVRELRNVLERAAMVCPHGEIRPEYLNLLPPSSPPTHALAKPTPPVVPRRPTLEEVERKMILDAWEHNSHHLEKTARELGIAIATLKRRLKAFKAEHPIPSWPGSGTLFTGKGQEPRSF